MITARLFVLAFLTGSRVRLGLALALLGLVVALLLLAWLRRFSRDARTLPILLFTGVVPLFFLAFLWPQVRLPILASLCGLLLLSGLSRRNRRALHLLMMLFSGFIPVFLLIGVEDIYWSAGFLLVYLGLLTVEPEIAGQGPSLSAEKVVPEPAGRARHFVYWVSVGFLWILVIAALLWYVPEPAAGI